MATAIHSTWPCFQGMTSFEYHATLPNPPVSTISAHGSDCSNAAGCVRVFLPRRKVGDSGGGTVIASISGIDLALVITEPTISGLHDARRIIDVARHFKIPVKVIINKYDLNLFMTEEIENFANENNIHVLGRISFDKEVIKAVVNGYPVVENKSSLAGNEISAVWTRLEKELL